MFVLFGYITNNNNQQNVHRSKTMMMHCRQCNVIMYIDVCICFYVFVLAHKQTNNNMINRDRGSSVSGYGMMKENNGKKEREREMKKEEEDVMNVHYAQFREKKGMEIIGECVILFGCAQRQSISNSVQIRAVNSCLTRYVLIFYIFLSIIHTQMYHTDG